MTNQPNQELNDKKWYWSFTHWECPICGKEEVIREKVRDKNESGHYFKVDSSCANYDLG